MSRRRKRVRTPRRVDPGNVIDQPRTGIAHGIFSSGKSAAAIPWFFINAFNHVNPNAPITNSEDPNVSRILISTKGRQLELALDLI
jgi:hypothetical protein